MIKSGIPGTTYMSPQLKNNLIDSKKKNLLLIMQWSRSSRRKIKKGSVEDEAHENIDSEIDENDLY